jgi:hypothetical protein
VESGGKAWLWTSDRYFGGSTLSAFDGRGARRGRERRGISSPVEVDTLEAISPELVLVDPVLRRRALAQLNQAPTPDVLAARPAPVAEPRPAPVRPPEALPPAPAAKRSHALRFAPVLLPAALVFGVVVALAASELDRQETTLVPTAPSRVAQPRHKSAPGEAEARSAAERALLAAVVESPQGRLPRTLINPQTGLARNNLQAVCRPEPGSRAFACVVQRAGKTPRPLLEVRYLPGTRGSTGRFVWGRRRAG